MFGAMKPVSLLFDQPTYMYTLGAGRILINSIIIVCLLNLMAWKASWAHRTGENGKKKIMIK